MTTQMVMTMDRPTQSIAPDSVTWDAAGDSPAHAFPNGKGMFRSACKLVRWTVLLHRLAEPPAQADACRDCWLLVYGTGS